MKNAFVYSSNVWLTALLLAPIPKGVITAIDVYHKLGIERAVISFVEFMLFMLVLGFIFSLLSYLLLYITSAALLKTRLSSGSYKMLLSIAATVYALAPFLQLQALHKYSQVNQLLIFSYVTVVVAGIWYFKVQRKNKEVNAVNS